MKIRSYKREFLDKVKEKFNDLQPSNKEHKSDTKHPRDDKKLKGCDSARVVVRG